MKSAGDKAMGHHQTYELYSLKYEKQTSFTQKEMDNQEVRSNDGGTKFRSTIVR